VPPARPHAGRALSVQPWRALSTPRAARRAQFVSSGQPQLFAAESSIVQGSLGDAWFLGALGCISARRELLETVIPSAGNGGANGSPCPDRTRCVPRPVLTGHAVSAMSVLDSCVCALWASCVCAPRPRPPRPLPHALAIPSAGIYTVRFFKNGQWRNVVIDDRIPCDQTGTPIYARSRDATEIWVCLVEKVPSVCLATPHPPPPAAASAAPPPPAPRAALGCAAGVMGGRRRGAGVCQATRVLRGSGER
jgi:hypothetical protein